MDSLAVNVLVIVLVIIDFINIILFSLVDLTADDQRDPVASLVLSFVVIGSLLVELTLRQVRVSVVVVVVVCLWLLWL